VVDKLVLLLTPDCCSIWTVIPVSIIKKMIWKLPSRLQRKKGSMSSYPRTMCVSFLLIRANGETPCTNVAWSWRAFMVCIANITVRVENKGVSWNVYIDTIQQASVIKTYVLSAGSASIQPDPSGDLPFGYGPAQSPSLLILRSVPQQHMKVLRSQL